MAMSYMRCGESQRIIQSLHDVRVDKEIYTPQMEDALMHTKDCDTCHAWFTEKMCLNVDTSTEDIPMLHGMMHEFLGDECANL